jgi:hypothetical protein
MPLSGSVHPIAYHQIADHGRPQIAMDLLRGHAIRGERCRAGVPDGHWKTTTFTGALRLTSVTAPFVHGGAMNGNVFLAYLEQVFLPTLQPGDIVVMDNLPAHIATGVHYAIERVGADSSSNDKLVTQPTVDLFC